MSNLTTTQATAALSVFDDELLSLQRQLDELIANLRLIQERKAEFVLSTEIPLQLVKEEQHLLRRITELKQQIAALPANRSVTSMSEQLLSTCPFQAGGPLLSDSPTYIPREADRKAAIHLRRMEYITLVEPRQHGKTSLINRLIGQFSPQGYTFAVRDLMAAQASSTSPTEWYTSLSDWILLQLNFISQDQQPQLPTDNASWERFLAKVATKAKSADQKVVIVLDEIGALPPSWATNFFSIIRSVYTSRQNLSFWQHITFIISGAFNPENLIQDDAVSKFNVDQRIPLDDFNLSQVKKLVAYLGLSDELTEAVAERIHYWTNGQPYLCQWLCFYLTHQEDSISVSTVDGAVDSFFQEDAQHLCRIRDMAANPDLLDYTRHITSEPCSRFNPAVNEKHFHLAHIDGVIKADPDRQCRIRNRIYERALTEIVEEKERIGGCNVTQLSPKIRAEGISFLLDIGRWAASELKERWKLARQRKYTEQTIEVDLSKPKEEVEEQTENFLQDLAANYGTTQVERVLTLIKRKRKLIYGWRLDKADNEEEYAQQRIARTAYRRRQQELDQKISDTLTEVEAGLNRLGVQVKKERESTG